ncbi:MAG TPA: hypothetical protein PKA62_03800, partial [Thermoanaerobaculia bacterium]|nr:hypothetical protein [Thermoanaerobaculia bacterium]
MPTDIVLSWGLRVRGTRARALARLLLAAGTVEKVLSLSPAEAVALGGEPGCEELLAPPGGPGLVAPRPRLDALRART